MNDTDPSAGKSGSGNPPDAKAADAPSANIVSAVVAKIKSEPLLFIIAVVVLICGLVAQATTLGSSDFRFVLIVIAILAVVAILGYYTLQALQVLKKSPPADRGIDAEFVGKKVEGEVTVVKGHEISTDANLRAKAKVDEVKAGGQLHVVEIDQIGGSPKAPAKPAEKAGTAAPEEPPTSQP